MTVSSPSAKREPERRVAMRHHRRRGGRRRAVPRARSVTSCVELLRPQLVELRELPLDAARRQPRAVDPEQHLVLAGRRARSCRRRPRGDVTSSSARAGTIASSLGHRAVDRRLLVREPVRVGRGHDQLAVAEADEDARSARAAPRRATTARPTRREASSSSASALDRATSAQRRLGQPREVLGAVACSAGTPHGPQLTRERSPRRGTRSSPRCRAAGATRSTQQPARHDHRAVAVDLGLERRPQRELHVRRRELELAAGSRAGARRRGSDGRARRDARADDGELRASSLARAR